MAEYLESDAVYEPPTGSYFLTPDEVPSLAEAIAEAIWNEEGTHTDTTETTVTTAIRAWMAKQE